MIIKKGKTDVITYFVLVDSAAGTPETALTITNIDATYTRAQAAAVKNDLTALAAVTTAHTDNKGIEIDATNAPGLYRVDWPDAAFATGADRVILTVTCSGCAPAHLLVQLVDYDPQDTVRLGLTALPNAAADAAGGLVISDAGGFDVDNRTLTAAQIATGVWQDATAGDFTVASSIGKSLYIANIAPGASGGHFIAGSNAGTTTVGALTVTGALTAGSIVGNITGNLSGSVGSISGVTFPSNFAALSITAGGIVKADLDTIKTQTVTCAAGVTVSPFVGSTGAAINGTNANTLSSHDPGETIMGATDLGTGAGLTSLASQASVDTIDNILDTEFPALVTAVDSIGNDLSSIMGVGFNPLADTLENVSVLVANIASILADTNELQTDWADGGRLDVILDARASQASVDTIDGIVDAILVDTAEIGVAGAGLTALGDARLANLDALISSRMATYAQPAGFLAATFPSDPADQSLVIAATDALATLIGDVPTNTELTTALDALPTAAENAAALLDLADGVETGLTPRQAMRLMVAALAGELSGAATTTIVIRNAVADSKDRITATVDGNGNRSAVTVDLT